MRKSIVGWLLGSALILSSSSAFAQFYGDPEDTPSNFVSVTTTSTSLVVGVVILTVSLATNRTKNVQTYLQQNPQAVRASLNLGAGEALADLAKIFSTDVRSLGQTIRRHRKRLSELANPATLTQIRAAEFVQIVERAIAEDRS